jgi:hypothetical protein
MWRKVVITLKASLSTAEDGDSSGGSRVGRGGGGGSSCDIEAQVPGTPTASNGGGGFSLTRLSSKADLQMIAAINKLPSKSRLGGIGANYGGTSSSGVSKGSRTVHYGYAKTEIEAPANLVFAWLCDERFDRGIREAYSQTWEKSSILEEVNDHSFVDFRLYPIGWPMHPRCVALRHLRKEFPDGTCVQLSVSIPFTKDQLKEAGVSMEGLDAAIFATYHSVLMVKPVSDKVSKLYFWASSDPKGHIPNWILKEKVPSILGIVSACKDQLDSGLLNAKRQTYTERMEKMRKRVAVKWNHEAVVEKCCNFVGGFIAMYLVDLSWWWTLVGMSCFFIEESISDIITVIMLKRVFVDLVRANALHGLTERWVAIRGQVLSLLSVCVTCTVSFVVVEALINPEPMERPWSRRLY